MISLHNELFDSFKINFEIEFLNKIKNTQRTEDLKNLLKINFSEIYLDEVTLKKNNNINYLNFYEKIKSNNDEIIAK